MTENNHFKNIIKATENFSIKITNDPCNINEHKEGFLDTLSEIAGNGGMSQIERMQSLFSKLGLPLIREEDLKEVRAKLVNSQLSGLAAKPSRI